MHITIINGPNLNLLGQREPHIYGSQSFEEYLIGLQSRFPEVSFDYFQSNHEGEIIDKLHQAAAAQTNGIVLNPAAFAHTSIAIADAISAINSPVVEVHISNIYAREPFRQHSYSAAAVKAVITGLGLQGYTAAVSFLIGQLQ
jgi:3-dehydroquinate dehydratase-2